MRVKSCGVPFLAVFFSFMLLGRAVAQNLPVKIIKVKGKVELTQPGFTQWRAAREGETLNASMSIRTGNDGEAVLVWGDGNAVKVQSLSVFHLNEAAADGADTKNKMAVDQGTVYAKAKKLSTQNSYFEIKTPSAIAGVRGSEIFVNVAADTGASSFAVAEGQFAITTENFELTLDQNLQVKVEVEAPAPPELEPVPPETQQEMQSTFQELQVVVETETSQAPTTGTSGTTEASGTTETTGTAEAAAEEPAVSSAVEQVQEAGDTVQDAIIDTVNTGEEVNQIQELEAGHGGVNIVIE